MRLKNLTVLLALYLSIICCKGNSELLKLESDDSIGLTKVEEETTINTKYLSLLDIVERLSVYIEEEHDHINLDEFNAKPSEKEAYINILKANSDEQRQSIESLYESTLNLLSSRINIDQYLNNLLSSRFMYLFMRTTNIKNYALTPPQQATHVIPTSKRLFNWHAQDKNLIRHKHFNNRLRIQSIQKFEILNLLIREAYRSCSVEELSTSTIEYLRKSVQLHPLLDGTSQDLGHPDAACGDYALLEELIFDPDDDKEDENSYENDFSSPLLSLIDIDIRKIAESFCSKKQKNNQEALKLLIRYLHNVNLNNTNTRDTELKPKEKKLLAKLLPIRATLDTEVYEAHTIPKERLFRITFTGNTTSASSLAVSEPTEYQAGIWPYELPYPDFLRKTIDLEIDHITPKRKQSKNQRKKQLRRKQLHQGIKAQPELGEKENLVLSGNDFPNYQKLMKDAIQEQSSEAQYQLGLRAYETWKTIGTEEAADEMRSWLESAANKGHKGAIDFLAKLEKTNAIYLGKNKPNKEEKGKEKIVEEPEEIESGEKEPISKIAHNLPPDNTIQIEEKIIQITPKRRWSFESDWVLPKGLRSFHRSMLPSPYPEHVSPNHQNTVNKFFDSEQQSNIKFKVFATLWISEGGKILNSSGSHRELIGPALAHNIPGKTLFGIFAHGNNQTYGKAYIKYVQTAILYIGLRPNVFMTE